MSNNTTEKTEIISKEEMDKLNTLKANIPTDLDSIFSFGTEGKTLFDVVYALLGESKGELVILERTNFFSAGELLTVVEGLWIAKYGLMSDGQYLTYEGQVPTADYWAIPELKDFIIMICKGRPSVDGKSRIQAIEALQQIKLKLETQQKPMSSV